MEGGKKRRRGEKTSWNHGTGCRMLEKIEER
jgi:hypothetical protein